MSRKPRNFQANYTYHITTRCNNREFNLKRGWCREVIIYTLQKALKKYDLVIYGLCRLTWGFFLFMETPNKIVDRPHFMLDGVYKSPKSNHDKGLFSERRVILTHHFALLI